MKTGVLLVVLSGVLAGVLAGYEPEATPNPPQNPHAEPPVCNQVCTRERRPVCAVDEYGNQRTYQNQCLIGYLNCKERTFYKYDFDGECPDDPTEYVDDQQMDAVNQIEDA